MSDLLLNSPFWISLLPWYYQSVHLKQNSSATFTLLNKNPTYVLYFCGNINDTLGLLFPGIFTNCKALLRVLFFKIYCLFALCLSGCGGRDWHFLVLLHKFNWWRCPRGEIRSWLRIYPLTTSSRIAPQRSLTAQSDILGFPLGDFCIHK